MKPTFKDKQKTVNKRLITLRSKATQSEIIFKDKLEGLKYKFIFQKSFIKGDFYCIVDFYLPAPKKLCIEIDGGYHNTPEQVRKDNYRDIYLTKERKFKVLRLTNEEAITISLDNLKILIDSRVML